MNDFSRVGFFKTTSILIGVWIKNLHRHEMEIVALVYCHDVRQILSVSKNGAIGVHHDFGLQTGESSLLRIMDPVQQHPNITSVALSRHDDFLTLGAADGLVQVWGVESGKVLQEFTLNPKAPGISSLVWFDPEESSTSSTTILAVGTEEAEIYLYAIQPLRLNHAPSPLCHFVQRLEQKCAPNVDIRGFSELDLIKRKTLARVHGYTLESLESLLPDIPFGSAPSSSTSASPAPTEQPGPVTRLIWEGATRQLVSASEEGLVFAWTLNFSPELHPDPPAATEGMNLRPSPNPPRMPRSCHPTLAFVRRVHSGSIVDLVALPPTLDGFVTASADNCVSAWSWSGVRYGTLVPDRVIPSVASRQPDWDVPADTRAIREAKAREAQELFQLVQLTSLRSAWDIPVTDEKEGAKVETLNPIMDSIKSSHRHGRVLELISSSSSTGQTLPSPKVRESQKKVQLEASLKARPKARFKSMAWKVSHVSKLQLLLEQMRKPIISEEGPASLEESQSQSVITGLVEAQSKNNRVVVYPVVKKPASLEWNDDAALETKAWLQPPARRALKKLQAAMRMTATYDDDHHHQRPNTPSRNVKIQLNEGEDKSESEEKVHNVGIEREEERVIATPVVETTKIS